MLVFLFTDIEGSSRMWEEHTDEMGAVIARHDAILQEQIGECGGRITKHTGDGGGQPIACALETQKRFAAEAWGAVGELRIRAGLHAGEAEFQASAGTPAGDYFGPPVNATAAHARGDHGLAPPSWRNTARPGGAPAQECERAPATLPVGPSPAPTARVPASAHALRPVDPSGRG